MKEYKDHQKCPKCGLFYGFVRCPVTVNGEWACLTCRIAEEKADGLETRSLETNEEAAAIVKDMQQKYESANKLIDG